MSCEAWGLLISKCADGEATAEESRRVEAHLASCAPCRRLSEVFRRNNGLVASAFGPEPFGQRVATGVLGSLARREQLLRGGARLAKAAGVLAAFVLGHAWASRSDPELEAFQEKLEIARSRIEALEAQTAAARPAVEREIIRETRYVVYEPGTGPRVLPEDELPPGIADRAVVDPPGVTHPVRPGTVAMDRLSALANGDTGVIALNWSMTAPPAGSVYYVFRRPEGSSDLGQPLHNFPLTDPAFEDASAPGLSVFEYIVVAVGSGRIQVCDDVARVTTPPDIRVEFKGLGTFEGRTSAVIAIRTRVDGRWSDEASWYPQPGDRHESTGFVFSEYSYRNKSSRIEVDEIENGRKVRKPFIWHRSEPQAVLQTPGGPVTIWSGETAAGSRHRLEVAGRDR